MSLRKLSNHRIGTARKVHKQMPQLIDFLSYLTKEKESEPCVVNRLHNQYSDPIGLQFPIYAASTTVRTMASIGRLFRSLGYPG